MDLMSKPDDYTHARKCLDFYQGNGNGSYDIIRHLRVLVDEMHRVRALLEKLAEKPPTDGVFR